MTTRSLRRLPLVLVASLTVATVAAVPPAAEARAADRTGSFGASTLGPPTYLRGTVVDRVTGDPVAGVKVTLRDIGHLGHVYATDMTDANGKFRMDGLHEDEYAVKFNGTRRGYEVGFLGCGRGVVPTWGEACSFGTGPVGTARLDPA